MSKPSENELCLLRAIWNSGRLSAREIHDATESLTGWSYSSTRKTLDRMQDKNLVSVSSVHGIKVYEAQQGKLNTLAGLIRDFSRNILDSDTPLPAAAFVGSKLITEDEIAELEALLKQAEDNT